MLVELYRIVRARVHERKCVSKPPLCECVNARECVLSFIRRVHLSTADLDNILFHILDVS